MAVKNLLARFGFQFDTKQAVSAAKDAADALEVLEGKIKSETKEVAAMQRAMRNLKGDSEGSAKEIKELTTRIDASKASVAASQAKFLSLGGTFKTNAPAARGLESRMQALMKAAQGMPGPIGLVVSKFEAFSKLVGGSRIALGIAAIAAGLLALVVASVKAAKHLYEYAVAQADARRSENLRLEGLTKMRFLYARAAGTADELQGAIDRVSAKVSVGRDKVTGYAESLYKMGMRGPALEKALEGVGLKASAQGEAAASAFAGFAAGANLAGQSVDKLVDRVKGRLGGIVQRQMSSLTVQAEKLKESQDALFGDLKMDRYLSAWKEVNDLFSQSTESGKALRTMLTSVLQPLIDTSAGSAPVVKRFFQGMIISALQLGIVVLQLRNWFRRTFGDVTLIKGSKDFSVGILLGRAALFLLIGGLMLAAVVAGGLALKLTAFLIPALWKGTGALIKFGLQGVVGAIRGLLGMASATWAALLPWLPFIVAILAVGVAIGVLIAYWDDLKMAFDQLDWKQAGKDAIMGIINGLTPWPLMKAMWDLGSDALGAFGKSIGAASPSKEFAKLGRAIPQGVAVGVDDGSPEAQAATDRMVSASTPDLGSQSGAGQSRGGDRAASAAAKGGAKIEIGEIHVHASSEDPKQMAMDFRRELERVLEGLALETASGVPA